ncbi:MbcA/ParS/Xre antitoxin family protein [Ralstonia solanacearum]|uniref:MbcA/ParS/Xre antitoxin family protein n=1 Tax=Ralstonia solanacearum TaxID=305 RepID=UPI00232592C3|nr:MbcA/ParS/Xre antitoxin family protein [Ralstonia solanacearum]MDB0569129.1 MbcA/ParS/Xre antitoxin family protein [Ralstonia solanacearum]MDB0578109.1 MbcA/ParS/Xre antitoxin family protein [Ralstonia solanacearum]
MSSYSYSVPTGQGRRESNFFWAFVWRPKLEKLPEGWEDFVRALEPEWKDDEIKAELGRLVADRFIAKAILGCLKSDAVKWLCRAVPMLENQRPIDLLRTEEGRSRVR